ncbi:recombinase, partial [Escherichia coli]|nr:recombinase [Escherichia coli]
TAIGTLPCIACHIHGQHSPVVSLHHIFGRTAENAHKYVLPLCKWHHQYAAPAEVRDQYPWLVPVHADGKIGGKADFMRHNADEMTLYLMAIELIN